METTCFGLLGTNELKFQFGCKLIIKCELPRDNVLECQVDDFGRIDASDQSNRGQVMETM